MKRWEIDEFDKLPLRESRKDYLTRKYTNMYNLDRWDHPWAHGKSQEAYILCDRILNKNIGKSFDDAFSYFCRRVDKQYQYIFLQRFDKSRWYYSDRWSVDDDKLIVYTQPIRFYRSNRRCYKDYRYYRNIAEKESKKRKADREYKLLQKQKEYNFLTKEEKQIKEARKLDHIKLISHGFDPVTSFRKDKER